MKRTEVKASTVAGTVYAAVQIQTPWSVKETVAGTALFLAQGISVVGTLFVTRFH
jgi:hypothetical protein